MSHVPEMQRFVEWLEAPGWEFGGHQGFGQTEYDRIWAQNRDDSLRAATEFPPGPTFSYTGARYFA